MKPDKIFLLIIALFVTEVNAQISFMPETIDNQVQIGYGLAIGDVNGDGRPDILLADKKAFVWYRNPDWKRFVIVENLTQRDNVCIAARDIDGDGKVEIAVGAQWNPGETKDPEASGSVHYLERPADPTQTWNAISLPHEPTVHRMDWVRTSDGFQLIVVPLHGRGNQQGKGKGVRIYAYPAPIKLETSGDRILVDSSMHITHNFDILPDGDYESLVVGGLEGARAFIYRNQQWIADPNPYYRMTEYNGFGEIRKSESFLAGIQPFHGNMLTLYLPGQIPKVLKEDLQQGHALACGDLLKQGMDQIIVGWREKNSLEEMGVTIFVASDPLWNQWTEYWVDQNEMACEDLKIGDLDGDGKPEIIAAGRSTNNLKIYWNRN